MSGGVSNEAAERLRHWFQNPDTRAILDEALATERRATATRLRRQLVRSLEAHVSSDRILLEFDQEASA